LSIVEKKAPLSQRVRDRGGRAIFDNKNALL